MIIEKLKDPATRLWYASKTLENGWSRAVLTVQIESRLHERSGKAITNFALTLPPAQSDLARGVEGSLHVRFSLAVGRGS